MRTLNVNFEEEEMKYINELAEKYSLSLKELGILIGSKQNDKKIQLLLRVSEQESKTIKDAAKQAGMSYSAFCIYAFNWFVDSGEIYQKDYFATSTRDKNEKGQRTKRILVYFKDKNDKLKLEEYANRFLVDASVLIRISAKIFIEVNGDEFGIDV